MQKNKLICIHNKAAKLKRKIKIYGGKSYESK